MKSARIGIAVGTLMCLCGGPSAFAQTTGDKVEINIFGGLSYWGAKNAKTQAGNLINVKPDEGGVFGFRITENLWNYVGIEESVTAYGTNNINLKGVPGVYGNYAVIRSSRTAVFHRTGDLLYRRPRAASGPLFKRAQVSTTFIPHRMPRTRRAIPTILCLATIRSLVRLPDRCSSAAAGRAL